MSNREAESAQISERKHPDPVAFEQEMTLVYLQLQGEFSRENVRRRMEDMGLPELVKAPSCKMKPLPKEWWIKGEDIEIPIGHARLPEKIAQVSPSMTHVKAVGGQSVKLDIITGDLPASYSTKVPLGKIKLPGKITQIRPSMTDVKVVSGQPLKLDIITGDLPASHPTKVALGKVKLPGKITQIRPSMTAVKAAGIQSIKLDIIMGDLPARHPTKVALSKAKLPGEITQICPSMTTVKAVGIQPVKLGEIVTHQPSAKGEKASLVVPALPNESLSVKLKKCQQFRAASIASPDLWAVWKEMGGPEVFLLDFGGNDTERLA